MPTRSDSHAPSFEALGVAPDLISVLARNGVVRPFDIQAATIADALAGRDVLGRAPTGSGKTLAFGIPLVERLKRAEPRRPTGLVLAPTRELAEQIRRDLDPLAQARDLRVLAIYGGVGFGGQLNALRRGVELVVATPGRLQDLIQQGEVSLDAVRRVVVDEADRMADMGFLPAVKQLLDLTHSDRQTVMFSATLGKEVKVLTDRYQSDPVQHSVGEVEPDLSLVTHRFIRSDRHNKVALAAHIIEEVDGPTIVFCRTRYGVDRVARQLKGEGVKTSLIHGKRSQNQRDNALAAFVDGKVTALVATDVAARGIHVDGVACVIHFDLPEEESAYVHRSGRTARAGASGVVVSFVNGDQLKDARQLQRTYGLDADIEDTPDLSHRPAPTPQPRNRGGQQGKKRQGQGQRSGKPGSRSGGSKPRQNPKSKNRGKNSAKNRSAKSGSRSGGESRGGPKQGGGKPGGPKRSGPKRGGPKGRGGSSRRPRR
ncbi:MAG: DEAD/DEAH box helicase [Acidimicrobiales bacterium]